MPFDEVLQLGPSGVAGNFDAPVADGTGVFFVFFYFATSDFEAFAVVPGRELLVHCRQEE